MHVPGRLDSEGDPPAQPAAPAPAALRPAGQAGVGAALRRARKAHGLTLGDVERALHIRERHLLALEAERFDDLPGDAYARLFLRAYAEHLGLDGDRLLELLAQTREQEEAGGEAGAAAAPPRPPEPAAPAEAADLPRAPAVLVRLDHGLARVPRWGRRAAWLVPALALVLVLALRSGGSGHVQLAPPVAGAHARPVSPLHDGRLAAPQVVAPSRARSTAPAVARVELAAPRGDCWLLVRDGSAEGQVLFEGMLHAGGAVTLQGRELWLRVGAPWNLALRVNGRAVSGLPARPANLVVSARGVKLAD